MIPALSFAMTHILLVRIAAGEYRGLVGVSR
jgi:hypothetical protein